MLTIHVEARPGDRVQDTAEEMVELANRIGIEVGCKFNDVKLHAKPETDPNEIIDRFCSKMKIKRSDIGL